MSCSYVGGWRGKEAPHQVIWAIKCTAPSIVKGWSKKGYCSMEYSEHQGWVGKVLRGVVDKGEGIFSVTSCQQVLEEVGN